MFAEFQKAGGGKSVHFIELVEGDGGWTIYAESFYLRFPFFQGSAKFK